MSQRHRKRTNSGAQTLLTVLIVILIALTGLVVFLCVNLALNPSRSTVQGNPNVTIAPGNTTQGTTAPETTAPPEPTAPEVVNRGTILSTGDVLMHIQLIRSGLQEDGSYNYDYMFRFIKDYVESADLAMANLETTTAGPAKPYQGNPLFNCPDEIDDALKNAGFDVLMTANNHCFDTTADGFLRTIEVARSKGFDVIGTMATAEEPKYIIKDVGGIKVGIVCYTYETSDGSGSHPALNGNPMYGATYENINCYRPANPQSMYDEVKTYLAEMEETGVDATILYIHWGPNEYELYANQKHQQIAQKLCDLGIDVIVGGHPHVVQPMDLLTSTEDPEHKTIVLYSMGNAVSNQRLGNISSVTTAHTEDGVLFSVTFCKYSDGTVYVQGVDLIPTWIHLTDNYYILPLDASREDEWQDLFQLDATTLGKAQNSHTRTMDLVGEGLEKCQQWLSQCQTERDSYYLDLAMNPGKYTATPETVPETAVETTAETLANAA